MAESVTVPGETIPELLEYWGSVESETPAFVSIHADGSRRTLSRKEVVDCSKRFAYKLRSLGVKSGDIVCNTLPNSLERVICEFGIQFAGAASLNGQILRSDGVDFFESLRISNCTFVIIDSEVESGTNKFMFHRSSDKFILRVTEFEGITIISSHRNDSKREKDFITTMKSDLPGFSTKVSPQDLATIMTTSGSTGYSKLVKHSQANICHFCKQVKAIEPLPSGSRFLNCAQLGWAGGYPQWYLGCGVTRYFIDMHAGPPVDTPSLLWNIIVQEKIDYGFMSPMFVNAILTKCPWQQTKWRPKVLCLAGQPVKKELMGVIGKLCDAVDVNYGMTECNLVTTHRVVEPEHYADGCAGYPGYGVELKVVDAHKQMVPSGTRGEIMIRSPSLFLGYVKDESGAESSFTEDGWFFTDDSGYVGKDGKIYIEGRQSDSIHRGVYILYPGWLEKEMKKGCEHHDIAIVAVPDAVLHHEICACVLVSGLQGIVAGCLHRTENILGKASAASGKQPDTRESLTASFSQHQPTSSSLLAANPSQREPTSSGLITANSSQHEPTSSSLLAANPSQLEQVSSSLTTASPSQHEPVCSRQRETEPDKRTFVESLVSQSNSSPENYAESVLLKVEKQYVDNEIKESVSLKVEKQSVDNEMKDTRDFSLTLNQSIASSVNTETTESVNLVVLETELRRVANEVNVLPKNDAMRMVPRYYVFMGAFPTTITGKIRRKELSAWAASALGL